MDLTWWEGSSLVVAALYPVLSGGVWISQSTMFCAAGLPTISCRPKARVREADEVLGLSQCAYRVIYMNSRCLRSKEGL